MLLIDSFLRVGFFVFFLFLDLSILSYTAPISTPDSGSYPKGPHFMCTSDCNKPHKFELQKLDSGIDYVPSKRIPPPPHLLKYSHHQQPDKTRDLVYVINPKNTIQKDYRGSTFKPVYPIASKLGRRHKNVLYSEITRENLKTIDMNDYDVIEKKFVSNELLESDESFDVTMVEQRTFLNVVTFFKKLRENLRAMRIHEETDSEEK